MVEVIHRSGGVEAHVVDYKLGAVKFHYTEYKGRMAVVRAMASVARAICKRVKEHPDE